MGSGKTQLLDEGVILDFTRDDICLSSKYRPGVIAAFRRYCARPGIVEKYGPLCLLERAVEHVRKAEKRASLKERVQFSKKI